MDDYSRQILKELLPVEKEVIPAKVKVRRKDEAPDLDHWSSPILLERAAYLRKLAKHGDGAGERDAEGVCAACDDAFVSRARWRGGVA